MSVRSPAGDAPADSVSRLCFQTLFPDCLSSFLSANVVDPIDPVNCVATGIFLIAGVSTVSDSMRQNTRCILPFTLRSQQHTTNSVTADCDCPYRLTFTCRQGITFTLLLTDLRLPIDWLFLQPVHFGQSFVRFFSTVSTYTCCAHSYSSCSPSTKGEW